MLTRSQQREASRQRIVDAAISVFSEFGFHGGSTREIARRAGVNQGLITYYYRSKESLWEAAAEDIFRELRSRLGPALRGSADADPSERARELVRQFVHFSAVRPEFVRMMMAEGRSASPRLDWLVENCLRPLYAAFSGFDAINGDETLTPHAYYVMAGSASLIFALAPECERLAGMDPTSKAAIERHADYVARLLVP